MAAGSLLQSERAGVALMVHRDVMKERFVAFWMVLSNKRAPGFLTGQTGLYRGRHQPNGCLRTENFQEVGVRNQRVLVEVE